MTPFDGKHSELIPIGKYILLEIVQDKPKEKKIGSIIAPTSNQAPRTFSVVKDIGEGVTIKLKKGDFVEINQQVYPDIANEEGFGTYMIVHEEQITGVYSSKG